MLTIRKNVLCRWHNAFLHPTKMYCAARTMHVCTFSSQGCDKRHSRGELVRKNKRESMSGIESVLI